MKANLVLKKWSISFLILFFALGCKLSQGPEKQNNNSVIGNLSFPGERNFIKSELDVGRRICAALKKKREYFQTFYDREKQVKFQGMAVNCQGTTTLNSSFFAAVGVTTSSLEYIALYPRENYFRDVITDHSAGLNDICTSLLATNNVSNVVISGNARYTVNFLMAENYDRYEIQKELSNGNGSYTISGAESISVITDTISAPEKYKGIEKERTRFTKCDAKKFQSIKQTWLEGW